ncbi:MAG TPA: hypothetical protein ENI94_12790 [Gammaproteobacteria bacterium]|nr:hypothetical protein [Gammaproteobacteria bacterium]
MAIFTDTEIQNNWLYAPVMEQINELHEKMGTPEAPNSGPTTGGPLSSVYAADSIGDWGGNEEYVADWANARREEVLNALNMGSYPYYYQSDDWTEFANQAYILVMEFDTYDAFQRLCDEWDNHQ